MFLMNFPHELIRCIIMRCDGLSLERLSRTSTFLCVMIREFLANASDEELSRASFPVHMASVDMHMHLHQLPNGILHGKVEIYERAIFALTYGPYNKATKFVLTVRTWFHKNKFHGSFKNISITYRVPCVIAIFNYGAIRKYCQCIPVNNYEFDKHETNPKLIFQHCVRDLRKNIITIEYGKNRKRGAYAI